MRYVDNPIHKDALRIMTEGIVTPNLGLRGVIHTKSNDVPVLKVTTYNLMRDYTTKYADRTTIEVLLGAGDYQAYILDERELYEFTLYVDYYIGDNKKTTHIRFKAILLDGENQMSIGKEHANIDHFSLNTQKIETIRFQLIHREIEPLVAKTVGRSFEGITMEVLIRSVLGGETAKVLVDGKKIIDGLDLIPPDNKERIHHIIIPSDTPLVTLPVALQERFRGVYHSGLGNYIQRWKNRLTWFIYPIYTPYRFDQNVPKAIFYYVPRQNYRNPKRTHRKEGDTLFIATTADKNYTDNKQKGQYYEGGGFKQTHADPMMLKPIIMTPDEPIASRSRANTEIVAYDGKDELNYARYGDRRVSSNLFAQTSRTNAARGARITLFWENAVPSEIHPGMPCQYVFLHKGKTVLRKGTIAYVEALYQVDGRSVTAKTHTVNAVIIMYSNRPMEQL